MAQKGYVGIQLQRHSESAFSQPLHLSPSTGGKPPGGGSGWLTSPREYACLHCRLTDSSSLGRRDMSLLSHGQQYLLLLHIGCFVNPFSSMNKTLKQWVGSKRAAFKLGVRLRRNEINVPRSLHELHQFFIRRSPRDDKTTVLNIMDKCLIHFITVSVTLRYLCRSVGLATSESFSR